MSRVPAASADLGPTQSPPSTLSPPGSPTSSTVPASPRSATHIPRVQPHGSFFRVSRPNDVRPPRPSSFVSASSTVQTRLIDAIHLAPLARQLSTASVSDVSSIAARRTAKYSREPLLPVRPSRRNSAAPINADADADVHATVVVASEPTSPASSAFRVRGSLDRLFKRSSSAVADALPVSPTQASPSRKSPAYADTPRTPPALQDGYFAQQSPPPSLHPPPPAPATTPVLFVPHPPHGYTPFVPVVSPKTGHPQRNYEGYPSRNTFFLRGLLLTGGDTLVPFAVSLILVLGISGTWFATTCVWWWHTESPAVALVGAYMCLVTISSMLATALRDPGILPRNLDPDPPYPAVSPSDGAPVQPFPRDLRIGEHIVRVKYCTTCHTYRPPRSSHCKACDNCVDACDHHCQWVNNCIGRRNYTSFIAFLVSSSLTLALAIVTAALQLSILTHRTRSRAPFRAALAAAPGSAVVFALGAIVIWPLFALMGYHVRLLLLNITTIEQVRNKVHASLVHGPAPPNPFARGRWHRNAAYVLCRPPGHTWIDAAGVRMEDQRKVNPGAWEDWEEGGGGE